MPFRCLFLLLSSNARPSHWRSYRPCLLPLPQSLGSMHGPPRPAYLYTMQSQLPFIKAPTCQVFCASSVQRALKEMLHGFRAAYKRYGILTGIWSTKVRHRTTKMKPRIQVSSVREISLWPLSSAQLQQLLLRELSRARALGQRMAIRSLSGP